MKELPITVKRSIELLGICAIAYIISAARNVVTPLLMAFFISILLLPLYRLLRRKKTPEVLAIICSIFSAALVIAFIIWFIWMQVARLISDIPAIQENLNIHWLNVSDWIDAKMHFSTKEQLEWLRLQSDNMLANAGRYLSGAALSLTNVFIFVGLLPIYTFLILYYKNILLRFVYHWFSEGEHGKVQSSLSEVEVIIKSYLTGLLIQVTYMTIFLGGLLLILGIKHALLIGVIFAILNLIPYVGALIGNIIGVLLTLTSSQDIMPVLTVLISIAAVQFLDNNILMPRIVGSKVRLNALASIVGVIVGGALAGIAGMFLSLPVLAIFKIIFDNSTSFKQWGILLGDDKAAAKTYKRLSFKRKPK